MPPYALIATLIALLAGIVIGKAWERYKLQNGTWIDRRRARQSPHYILGLNFLVSSQIDLAIEELTQAASQDANALEVHMILGNLFREKGQVGKAITIHQSLLQRQKLNRTEHPYVLLCLGLDFRHAGFVDRALEAFKDVVRLDPDGPCDHRVKVLRFDDGRTLEPMSVLMHAVCHPCVFTWGDKLTPPFPNGFPKITADFPGEAQTFVEKIYGPQTNALFLQGCAGDIRPNLPGVPYRCGDEADIRWTGRSLGCAVVRAVDRSAVRENLAKRKSIYPLKVATSTIELPGKKEKVACEMQALRVGDFLFLTIPGEPMVEYGFQIEKAIADRAIPIVVGYANDSLGYICTAESHQYGGYEPNMSPLLPEAEPLILDELGRLADKVLADVFESFKPVTK